MKAAINAGRLRHRISIQQPADTTAPDGGDITPGWANVIVDMRVEAEPLRGREFFAAGQALATVDVRFSGRWREGITPAMRAIWRGVPYGIVAAINVRGEGVKLELMCSSGARDAAPSQAVA